MFSFPDSMAQNNGIHLLQYNLSAFHHYCKTYNLSILSQAETKVSILCIIKLNNTVFWLHKINIGGDLKKTD